VDWAAVRRELETTGFGRPRLLELIRRDAAEDLATFFRRAVGQADIRLGRRLADAAPE